MLLAHRYFGLILTTGCLLAVVATTRGDDEKGSAGFEPLRDGFETEQPVWQREYSDATVRLIAQDRTDRAAHGGRLSEHFQFQATGGRQFFVSYATPKIPITDELGVVLHARSTRSGIQIFGRVVLPADVDPETKSPSFVLVSGTILDQPDRWQRLELADLKTSVERQARVLRASSKRKVPLEGAYLERVVVNLMGGEGESNVFLDDLEISPVSRALVAEAEANAKAKVKAADSGDSRLLPAVERVRLDRNLLKKKGADGQFHGWVPTAIDAPGASLPRLRLAGFDVLVDHLDLPREQLEAAVKNGFLLMPRLQIFGDGAGPQSVLEQIAKYPLPEGAAFWDLGDRLGRLRELKAREEELARVRACMSAIRGLDDDVSRLLTAKVEGELPLYTRSPAGLDIVGIEPRYWATNQNFSDTYEYLLQRKRLTVRSNVGGLFWAWINMKTPPEVVKNIWGEDSPPSWGIPPVQPEQIRLMTYLALAAGYRAIGYMGDADLTRPAGQILLNELSFLNLEIDLCEEILAQSTEAKAKLLPVFDPPPPPIATNATQLATKRPTSVREFSPKGGLGAGTIVMVGRKGSLLFIGDFAGGAQFQPGQLAYPSLMITPVLPVGCQGFEISPGGVNVLEPARAPGGIQFVLEEFDTTRLLLCTTDMALYERIRTAVERVRPRAIPLAIQQAELQLKAVREIHERLEADGHGIRTDTDLKLRRQAGIESKPTDARDLLARSETYIKSARDALEREDYAWAWAEARRALRPLRLLMSSHWNQAWNTFAEAAGVPKPKPINTPKEKKLPPAKPAILLAAPSCPPLISFFTLPELYIWADWIKGRPGYRFGRNLLPSGNFNDRESLVRSEWVNVSYEYEGIDRDKLISTVPRMQVNGKSPNPKSPSVDELSRDNVPGNLVLKMKVWPEKPELLDEMPGFLDFPAAAIRSPSIRVEANNLIRISVMVRRPLPSAEGLGGIIVRDSIGGEQFQYRASGAIPTFSKVVMYRKAPANGTFNVTLGLAGFGEAYFDDLRVEVIEEGPIPDNRATDPGLVDDSGRGRPTDRPLLPEPNPDAAAVRMDDSRRQPR